MRWYDPVVPTLTLAAMLEARPDRPFWGHNWVESVFETHLAGYSASGNHLANRLDGWCVGGCMGAETLVQSRPVARPTDNAVRDLLRSGARCSLGVFHASKTADPPCAHTPQTARFQRWMAAVASPPLTEGRRSAVLGGLPQFLARDAIRAPDVQLHLLSVLAKLFAATGFQNAFAQPDAVAKALHEYVAQDPDEAPHALLMSDGRTLAILVREGCLLSSLPPPDARPATGLLSDPPGFIPASLWLWTPHAPSDPPRDAERLGSGLYTVDAADPGTPRRHDPPA